MLHTSHCTCSLTRTVKMNYYKKFSQSNCTALLLNTDMEDKYIFFMFNTRSLKHALLIF